MKVMYSEKRNMFHAVCAFRDRHRLRDAGWTWDDEHKRWLNQSPYAVMPFYEYASSKVRELGAIQQIRSNILESQAASFDEIFSGCLSIPIPAPDGLDYLDYQKVGIWVGAKRETCMIADEQGLGKTIQAIGISNMLGLKKILVICPAIVRINWQREISKWHVARTPVRPLLKGTDLKLVVRDGFSSVVSYDLASRLDPRVLEMLSVSFDHIIIDEAHYLKSPKAERTRRILGVKKQGGLIHLAPVKTLLTGTPAPNRPHEMYTYLKKLSPQSIDNMGYMDFLRKFAKFHHDGFDIRVTGVKKPEEFSARVRANFIIRRLKSDVLSQLPPKIFKMVIFPKDSRTCKVLTKEKPYNAHEILKNGGALADPALPELRREMGIAKVPVCAQYIGNLLENGLNKVIVFAHHRDVVTSLGEKLNGYNPVTVLGGTNAKESQRCVDAFQQDDNCRIFIGSAKAAGIGITLTATDTVVFVEPSWVPADNEQCIDRAHRLGQRSDHFDVHYLVVEDSLDAKILCGAANKAEDTACVLNKQWGLT